MKIIESICKNNRRYKANNPLSPVGVVLHSIGCAQPRAQVLVNSWANDRSQYMTHYILDDAEIHHCMPNNRKCYHVGSPGNSKWIGIEMCEPKQIKYTSGATFTVSDKAAARAYVRKCYENAVWLIAKLCKEYGWNPDTAILTHNEVTTKKLSNTTHVDPEHLWKGLDMPYSLATLRKDVRSKMGNTSASAPMEKPVEIPVEDVKPDAAKSFLGTLKGRYIVTASDGLNMRTGAGTANAIIATLPKGTSVQHYGYFTRASNGTRWLFVATVVNNKVIQGYCSEKYLKKV